MRHSYLVHKMVVNSYLEAKYTGSQLYRGKNTGKQLFRLKEYWYTATYSQNILERSYLEQKYWEIVV